MKQIDHKRLADWFWEPDGIDIKNGNHVFLDAFLWALESTGSPYEKAER